MLRQTVSPTGSKINSSVKINFPDFVTSSTCSELVIELLKYILYMKEQIPYQFNRLKDVVEKKKKWDTLKLTSCDAPEISERKLVSQSTRIAADQYYSKASQALDSLDFIFQRIREEIQSASAVAMLLGATIATPQEAYTIELPPLFPSTLGAPPSRNCLTHLVKELLTLQPLQDMAKLSSRPSNIFIFIRKPSSTEESWFQSRPNYSIPSRCHQLSLEFCQPSSCRDPDFKIYSDPLPGCPSPMCPTPQRYHSPKNCPSEDHWQWYQSQRFVKGFKDCWIGDECATEIWLKI